MVEIQRKLLRERALLRQWEKQLGWGGGGGGGWGGVSMMERSGCCGVSGVYSKGDGRLGSGGLPWCGSGLVECSFWKPLTTSDRVLGSAVGKGLCGPLWLLRLFWMSGWKSFRLGYLIGAGLLWGAFGTRSEWRGGWSRLWKGGRMGVWTVISLDGGKLGGFGMVIEVIGVWRCKWSGLSLFGLSYFA